MQIDNALSDEAVLGELGRRIARLRLAGNVDQTELASRAGVGRATLQRLEAGRPTSLTNLIRVLRALGRLDQLELGVPNPPPSPLEQLQLRGRERRRARRPEAEPDRSSEAGWRWGDEEQ